MKYLRSCFIIFSDDEYGGVQMDEELHLMLILSSLAFKLSHLLAVTMFFASFPKYLSSLIS